MVTPFVSSVLRWPVSRWPVSRWQFLRRFTVLLGVTAVLLVGPGHWWVTRYRLCVNLSPSVAGRFYLLRLGGPPPRRGELVAFHAPATAGYARGALFLKYVVGVPGDEVRHDPDRRGWSVRGRSLGRVKTHSRRGAPLRRGPEGPVPPGFYVLWAPHPDSYDSRYAAIGWIPREHIVGRGLLLF